MPEAENPEPSEPQVMHLGLLLKAEPDDASRYYAHALSRMHLTDRDIIQLADERGLAPGILGSRAVQAADGWLGEQYEVNKEALRDLGFRPHELEEEAPSFDEVVKTIGGVPTLVKLGRRQQLGRQDGLLVLPNIRSVGLMGTSDAPGYIPRYNRKEGLASKIHVTDDVWSTYADRAVEHDPLAPESTKWIVALWLDAGKKSSVLGIGDRHGESGLLYSGLTVEEQRELLKADQEVSEFDDRFVLAAAGVTHYLVRNAQLRVLGEPLLDSRDVDEELLRERSRSVPLLPFFDEDRGQEEVGGTFTNFIHYPNVKIGFKGRVPAARARKRQIQLGMAEVDTSAPGGGIREILQVKPPTE